MAGETPTNSHPTAATAHSTDLTPPRSARTPSLKAGLSISVDDRKWLRNVWETFYAGSGFGEAPAWGETEKTLVRAICGHSGGVLRAGAIMAAAAVNWTGQLRDEIQSYRKKNHDSTPVDAAPELRYIEKVLCVSEYRKGWRAKAEEAFAAYTASEIVPPVPSAIGELSHVG